MKTVRTTALLAVVLCLCTSGLEDAGAQSPHAGVYDQTALEQEALRLLGENQLVTARTKADEVLSGRPNSIVGHYVLGRVLREAEGSLARAMLHLGRARELYEQTFRGDARASGPADLHRDILYNTAQLAGEMELFEFQLELLGYHDYLYDPDLVGERAWPLMQLGRAQEARDFARRAVGSQNSWQKSAGLNAMCAIEGEARSRQPYYDACKAALEGARRETADRAPNSEDEGGGITVDAYNAALAASAALRSEEAEQFALEGVRRIEFTPASPWRFLLQTYLSQGRFDDAIEALRNMQSWKNRQPAYLRDQARAEDDGVFAALLLVGGETNLASHSVDRAIDNPDRRGLTTSNAEQARAHHALLRQMIRRVLIEEHQEEASWHGLSSRLGAAFGAVAESVAGWPDDERVSAVLTDEETLIATLRPYIQGGIAENAPWIVGELVDIVGPGVIAVALETARRQDRDQPPDMRTRLFAYYDALEGEVELVRGNDGRARALVESALRDLPPTESLLRARVAAVGSEAAPTERERLAFLEQVLQLDPSTIRRMDLTLPARIRVEGSGLAREAAELIEASPRLSSGSPSFEVVVSSTGQGLSACLLDQHGNQVRCATVAPEPEPTRESTTPTAQGEVPAADDEEPAERLTLPQQLAREFHRQVFSARMALSTVDMRSLDGRTSSGSQVVRDQLEGLLQEQQQR